MNPFLTIWSRPKETLQYILDQKTVGYAILLVVLGALANSVMGAADSGLFGDLPLIAILVILFGGAILISLFSWGLTTMLYTLVGKMLGGNGTMSNVGKVVGTATLPGLWLAPFNLVMLIVYGRDLFAEPEYFQLTVMPIAIYIIYNLVMLGISVYSIVIQSMGLGLAHGFSSLRGFGVIAIVLRFVFIIAFIIIFTIISFFIFNF